MQCKGNLTKEQQMANVAFFEKTLSMLNINGVWASDVGSMTKIDSSHFLADDETYFVMTHLVPEWYVKARIINSGL